VTYQCNGNKNKTKNLLCNFYEKVKNVLLPKSAEIISSGYSTRTI